MQRNQTPYFRIAIAVIALAFVIAWQQAGQSQNRNPAAPAILGGRPPVSWTRLPANGDLSVSVAKVPGGWFVAVENRGLNPREVFNVGGAFFYPDPDHLWDGTSL